MKTAYAVQCDFAVDREDLHSEVWRMVGTWLERTHPGVPLSDTLTTQDAGEVDLGEGQLGRWVTVKVDDAMVRRFEHRIPPSPTTPSGWTTRLWVCDTGANVWSVVRAGPDLPSGVVTSNNYDAWRPGIVGNWAGEFTIARDGLRIGSQAWNWGLNDLQRLADLLLDPKRTLPVVAVSKAHRDGKHEVLLDVRRLASQLTGNAHVVVVDRALSWEIVQHIGQPLNAYNGAARIWWPGLTPDDDPARHPLFVGDRIIENPEKAKRFLIRRVWAAAVDAVAPPALERRLISLRSQRQVEARVEALRSNKTDVDEILVEWERTLDENQRLQDLIEELEGQLEDLSDELRSARVGADPQRGEELPDVESVEEAVRLASTEAENVVYLQSAFDSARASHYPDPQQVLLDLRAINRVAAKWAAGQMGGDFRAAFAEEQVRFQPGIGGQAASKYKADYEIVVGGRRVLMGPHLRRGVGAPTEILRIYWFTDDATKQLFVGHVGRKLRDVSNP